ncbi:Potassium channel protein [Desulfonema magnum]|uniref:Potassium channel protein n=2 Tax=Desulfonema magnum TaxID=45655 RepID=A0A975BR60_9BACT|nr:Potassium channel protein [Desulfonema magnum]
MIIEGWDIFDSVYMTVITLATVGYGEVHEVSRLGRIYTMFLIFIGGGFCVYVAGLAVQFMVEGQIRAILGRKRLDRKIRRLKDHYIICGYGRIGRVLCSKLKKGKSFDLVVIEKNRKLVPVMDEDKILYIAGDAADETNLINAHIKRAKCLVAVLATDIDNVYLVLTARQLNPDIYIMARAGSQEAKSKLRAAGANKVESPYEMGALSMAQRILRPTVTNFLDLALAYKHKDIQMEEIPVTASSELADVMLKDSGIRQNYNLIIIAIKKPDGSMLFNPSFDTRLNAGDTVITVGEGANLNKLEKVLNP